MSWSQEELRSYRDRGYALCRGLLSSAEVTNLREALPRLLNGEGDGMHRERERGGAVRQVYLAHRHVGAFSEVVRHSAILEPVKQIVVGDVYVWHSKLNVKEAFEGTVWLWHQDYGYWMWDGVDPRLVSAMVILDRSTANNGCMMVVAGSHKWGRQEHFADEETTSYKQWCIDTETLKTKLREERIQQITGEPGDVLFFDCNLVHGSGHNMSPLPRKVFIIAYNSVDNRPRPVENPRPDWVVARTYDPVG